MAIPYPPILHLAILPRAAALVATLDCYLAPVPLLRRTVRWGRLTHLCGAVLACGGHHFVRQVSCPYWLATAPSLQQRAIEKVMLLGSCPLRGATEVVRRAGAAYQ